MMDIKDLTPQDIERMNYNELIGLVKETNRPPGGKESIFQILNRTFLTENSRVLEIGTSTGFTAIEIAKLIHCQIRAIDINDMSLKEARKRVRSEGLSRIEFIHVDATNLPLKNEFFDLVFCGNVLSLIHDKKKALLEYKRVLKNSGFIALIPMYYLKNPPNSIIKKVSDAIKVNIKPTNKKYWIDFLKDPDLEYYWVKDFKFDYLPKKKIDSFIQLILKREYLNQLSEEAQRVLMRKYSYFMHLFNKNLSYMGFSIILMRKKSPYEDPQLFVSKEIK